jgi:hypothetical protein
LREIVADFLHGFWLLKLSGKLKRKISEDFVGAQKSRRKFPCKNPTSNLPRQRRLSKFFVDSLCGFSLVVRQVITAVTRNCWFWVASTLFSRINYLSGELSSLASQLHVAAKRWQKAVKTQSLKLNISNFAESELQKRWNLNMSFWINFWLSIFRFLKLCVIFKDAELGKNNETIHCCFSLSLHCYIRVVENSQFGEIPKLFCAKPILLFAWFWKDLELLLIRHLPTAVTRNCWFSVPSCFFTNKFYLSGNNSVRWLHNFTWPRNVSTNRTYTKRLKTIT